MHLGNIISSGLYCFGAKGNRLRSRRSFRAMFFVFFLLCIWIKSTARTRHLPVAGWELNSWTCAIYQYKIRKGFRQCPSRQGAQPKAFQIASLLVGGYILPWSRMSEEVKNELCGGNTVEQGTGNITEKTQRKNKLLKMVYCRNQIWGNVQHP